EDNQAFLGSQVEVLVEGPSKAGLKQQDETECPIQMVGRTTCDRIVVFDGNRRQAGQILPVAVYDANAHTLFGVVVTHHLQTLELSSLATPGNT
ncbi:MAG: TRAM domain-containing protein, partial [Planctomycetales bacterium]|nr:TRAM domain-containing protein [Planctomycetales bacterium]